MLTKKDLSAIKELFNDKFDGINERFDGIDQRFEGTDKKFDGINKRFDGINKKLEVMSDLIKEVSNRLDINTTDLTDLILAGFTTHEPMLANHEKRIITLEKATFKSN